MSTEPLRPTMGEPDASGRFGRFGGRFVPETLMPACIELDAAFRDAWADPAFRAELDGLLHDYAAYRRFKSSEYLLSIREDDEEAGKIA